MKYLEDSKLIYLVVVASHVVLLTLVGVFVMIAFPNLTSRINSFSIAMWS
jgi:hypothetical protein